MKLLVVEGVNIPLPCDEHGLSGFITPFWIEVFEAYQVYVSERRKFGRKPMPIQPFLLTVAKELEKFGGRDRTDDQWMRRMMEHFGLAWLERRVSEARRYYEQSVSKVVDDGRPVVHGCCVDRKLGILDGNACTAESCMGLPDGKTCGDCVHVRRCLALGCIKDASQTSCDFFPRRFLAPVETRVEAAGGLG